MQTHAKHTHTQKLHNNIHPVSHYTLAHWPRKFDYEYSLPTINSQNSFTALAERKWIQNRLMNSIVQSTLTGSNNMPPSTKLTLIIKLATYSIGLFLY